MTKPRPDTPLQREMERAARDIGRLIADSVPDGTGFVLLVAGRDTRPETTYIANIHRDDCVKLLREMADTLERNEDQPPP